MKTTPMLHKNSLKTSFVLAVILALLAVSSARAANGSLDPKFGTNGFVVTDLGSNADSGHRIALSSDGSKIFALGSTVENTIRKPVIVHYGINGSLDKGYGTNGRFDIGADYSTPCDFAFDSDGKMVLAMRSPDGLAIARYLSDGVTLDNTFGTNGRTILPFGSGFLYDCDDIAIQPDHKIVVVGYEWYYSANHIYGFAVRLNQDGTRDVQDWFDDQQFPHAFYMMHAAVAFQADGKMVMSAGIMDDGGDGHISLARFNTNLSLDTTFGTNGKGTVMVPVPSFFTYKSSLVIQTDGKYVVAGTTLADFHNINENLAVARFNTNGSLDTSFGGTGIVNSDFGNNEQANDVVLQKDGKIDVVGKSYNETASDFLLARYNINGSLDTTFGANGKVIGDFDGDVESGNEAVLQPDGKLLIVGTSDNNMAIARYDMGSAGSAPVTKTFSSIGASDGWVLESAETSNTGATLNAPATTFNAGDDQRDRQYRGILSFQTNSIPDNAFVTAVQLKIRKQGVVGVNPFTTHGNLLAEIRKGAFSNNVALQLGDFGWPASSTVQDQFAPLAPLTLSWYGATLTDTNMALINKVGVTQFRIRFTKDDDDDMKADYVKFFSGNATSSTDWPKLVMTYYMP